MKRRLPASLAAVALLALAGCGGGAAKPGAAPSYVPARPAGVQDPAVIPSGGAAADNSCDPLASYRPPASMPSAGAMPAGSAMRTIQDRGRLIVGVDQNTYLFGFRDAASGQIVGFDIDIAREVARAIFGDPDKIQLKAITSAQRIPYVSDGTVDLVADTMTINCARWKQVAFSTDYYNAGQRVLVAKSSPVKGIADLGGKKVCAAAGSTSIVNIANAASKPVPVAVSDWTDCLVLLQQNQIDAISTDDTILAGLAAQDPNLHLVGDPFTQEPYGLAMKKESADLVGFVNGVLDRMRADGTWGKLYAKWLGGPAPQPPAARYK
jgi:polar amino acid transport system substrate-binding protein